MPRPERIEYENAIYHVMNRGRGRQFIFHGEEYYRDFEKTLEEAHKRFGVLIHAYCLMGNHYHLLIQTPRGNLSRVMRHINGVYTQRYNRRKRTDGPLFRGRYKALLVENDIYALYVSRYIHRNPIEMKKPIVDKLENYQYSSYRTYIKKVKPPEWLEQSLLFDLEGSKNRFSGMQRFVELGVDQETDQLYSKQRWPMVYGGESFRTWVYDVKLAGKHAPQKASIVTNLASKEEILSAVANYYEVSIESLLAMKRGRGYQNPGRNMSIYLFQEVGGMKLSEIAPVFGLCHSNSVSYVTSRMRKELKTNKNLRADCKEISRIICDNVT